MNTAREAREKINMPINTEKAFKGYEHQADFVHTLCGGGGQRVFWDPEQTFVALDALFIHSDRSFSYSEWHPLSLVSLAASSDANFNRFVCKISVIVQLTEAGDRFV
jgi:hypothetical protein